MKMNEMRDEYDFSNAKRGVVHGKIKKNKISDSKEITAQTKGLAVCIKTFDSKSLIIRKIYNVIYLANNFVAVVDEEGGNEIYPAEFFLPLSLSAEIENALAKIAA